MYNSVTDTCSEGLKSIFSLFQKKSIEDLNQTKVKPKVWTTYVNEIFNGILDPNSTMTAKSFRVSYLSFVESVNNKGKARSKNFKIVLPNNSEEKISDLFNEVMSMRQNKSETQKVISYVVKSDLFSCFYTSFPQQYSEQEKEMGMEKENRAYFEEKIIPKMLQYTFSNYSFTKNEDFKDWFLSTMLVTSSKKSINRRFKLEEKIPQSVLDRLFPERCRLGEEVAKTMNRNSLAGLIYLLGGKVDKCITPHVTDDVMNIYGKYLELFSQAKEGDEDYSEDYKELILLGFSVFINMMGEEPKPLEPLLKKENTQPYVACLCAIVACGVFYLYRT